MSGRKARKKTVILCSTLQVGKQFIANRKQVIQATYSYKVQYISSVTDLVEKIKQSFPESNKKIDTP